MKPEWHTQWQGKDLVVERDGREIDRVAAAEIELAIVVYGDRGATPGDLDFVLLRTHTHDLVLPAETGIANRLHFERQAFWHARRCVYWAPAARAVLPRRLCQGLWILRQHKPGFLRLPRQQLDPVIASWPLEGPQTWDERKWELIERMRPFAALRTVAAPVTLRQMRGSA
ncbi:MAG: hypothetical protein U1E89_15375 [Burkholderiaceae bacterium]